MKVVKVIKVQVAAFTAVTVLLASCQAVVPTPEAGPPAGPELDRDRLYSAASGRQSWCRVNLPKSVLPAKTRRSLLPRLANSKDKIKELIVERYKNRLPCAFGACANTTIHVLEYRRGTSGDWSVFERGDVNKRRNGVVFTFRQWGAGSATLQVRHQTYTVKASTGSAPSGHSIVNGASSTRATELRRGVVISETWNVFLKDTPAASTPSTFTVPHGAYKGCSLLYKPAPTPDSSPPPTNCRFELSGNETGYDLAARVWYLVLAGFWNQKLMWNQNPEAPPDTGAAADINKWVELTRADGTYSNGKVVFRPTTTNLAGNAVSVGPNSVLENFDRTTGRANFSYSALVCG